VNITEVLDFDGERVEVQDIFHFRQTGVDEDGRVLGYLTATGVLPRCLEQLSAAGETLDPSIFTPLNPAVVGGTA
jgi:pilus assembly protein CpaF